MTAGVTVLVQPSPEVDADRLLQFYRTIYDKANCYQRRGMSDGFAKLMSLDELNTDLLFEISESIRLKVWQLTKQSPPACAAQSREDNDACAGGVPGA